jgi:hypothetical protein
MPVLHVDGKLYSAAADSPLHVRTNASFRLGQRLGHTKLQVEMPMIDGPDRDRNGCGIRLFGGRSKPRHAFNHV